jgi:hypothetical protein
MTYRLAARTRRARGPQERTLGRGPGRMRVRGRGRSRWSQSPSRGGWTVPLPGLLGEMGASWVFFLDCVGGRRRYRHCSAKARTPRDWFGWRGARMPMLGRLHDRVGWTPSLCPVSWVRSTTGRLVVVSRSVFQPYNHLVWVATERRSESSAAAAAQCRARDRAVVGCRSD